MPETDPSKSKGLRNGPAKGRVALTSGSWLGAGEVSGLWVLAPPLLVMVLAGLIFDVAASDILSLQKQLAAILENPGQGTIQQGLAESRARIFWATTVLLTATTGLALLITAFSILWRDLSRRGFILYVIIGCLLSFGSALFFFVSDPEKNGIAAVFFFTHNSLAVTSYFSDHHLLMIQILVHSLNTVGVLAPIFGVLAGCATLLPRPDLSSDAHAEADLVLLRGQMRRLKTLLNLGSAVLVTGILHLIVWGRWPASLVGDDKVSDQVLHLANSVGIYWGAAYTLMIIAFYAPASLVISRRAEVTLKRFPEQAGGLDVSAWMKKVGLSAAPIHQLPQVAMMLAPLLAGPAGSLIGNLSSSLGAS
ncbi:MAG: hypothetical protein AAF530_08815 [Pseudomonadota bacterium]